MSITLLLLSIAYSSAAQMPPPRDGGRGGPPPEAFAACAAASQASVCTVETPRGTLEGVCQSDRRSEALVCMPEGGRKGQRPPQDEQEQDEKKQDGQNIEPPDSASQREQG